MYTIGQVSQRFGLPVSTLRYYDKEGLFPDLARSGGIRKFDEKDLEAIRVIECLKRSGMEIRDIKQFMEWCTQGSATYSLRRDMFIRQRKRMEEEIRRLERVRDMLDYKCWYYGEAMKDGNEERLGAMKPEDMPEPIRGAYERAHEAAERG